MQTLTDADEYDSGGFDSEEYDYEDDLDLNETSGLERLTDPDLEEKIVK